VRSGDEPLHARSALRLRLVLAVVGGVGAAALAVRWWALGEPIWAAGAAAVTAVAILNVVLVAARQRSGAHYQPGPDVPPYRPVAADRTSREVEDVPESVRLRRYLLMMGVCLTLITVAWVWVRLVSVPIAIGMSAVAAVIPPLASIVANAGWTGRRRR
jgi:Family of unknown function (DUF6343)/Protein of unknown function (DUF3099)